MDSTKSCQVQLSGTQKHEIHKIVVPKGVTDDELLERVVKAKNNYQKGELDCGVVEIWFQAKLGEPVIFLGDQSGFSERIRQWFEYKYTRGTKGFQTELHLFIDEVMSLYDLGDQYLIKKKPVAVETKH